MFSNYIYTAIIFICSLSNCRGQKASTDPFNYLVDNAFLFENGIHSYSENGKYGFQYKHHRITDPVYDTLFKFGKDFCVAKRDTIYILLDRNLKSRFYQPIRSVEKWYDTEKSIFVMTARSFKGISYEYTTGSADDWKLKSTPFSYYSPPYDTQDYKTDSLDNVDLFPEATSPQRGLMCTTYGSEKPYWKILCAEGQVKFFLIKGEAFIRNRPGMVFKDYYGESLVEYRDYETNKAMIINERTEDIILPSDSIVTYYKYRLGAFFEKGQLYLYKNNYNHNGITERISVYDAKGQLLHTTAPISIHKDKNTLILDPYFRTIEEIVRLESKRHPRVYMMYSPIDGTKILKNGVLCDQSGNYRLYYSTDEKQFFLLHDGRVIYSFPMKKGIYVWMDAFFDDNSLSNELIVIHRRTHKEVPVESILLSSSGKILDRTRDGSYQMHLSIDQKAIEVLRQTDSAGVELAIYTPETEQLYWVPFRKPDRDVRVFTANVIHYSGSDGEQSFETRDGESILELGKGTVSATELKTNHFLIVAHTDGKSVIYNSNFKQICDNCSIRSVNDKYLIFALFRDPKSDLFELVDESLTPISNQRYRAALGKAGKLIAVLTEANEIEYLTVGE